MPALTSNIDGFPYKMNAEFRDDVVIHRQSGRGWWKKFLGPEEEWIRVRSIGSGSFGVVWLEEESTTGQLRAVKRIAMPPVDLVGRRGHVDFRRELQTLIDLREREDLFVHFFGWYQDPGKNFIYFAMEYVEYGDLGKYLKNLGPWARANAKEITRQILEGLMVLHKSYICHRDLKPENVLVASFSPIHVKLADFGVSKRAEGTKLKTQVGTLAYQAPELLGLAPRNSASKGNDYTTAVDMWALGCLLYQTLTMETPFAVKPSDPDPGVTGLGLDINSTHTTLSGVIDPHDSRPQPDMDLFCAYCSGTAELPTEALRPKVSHSGVDLIKRLLDPDPNSRISSADAMNHPWMFDFPGIFDSQNNSKTMWSQFTSLGMEISLSTTEKLISRCRKEHRVGVGKYLSPSIEDLPRLRNAAVSQGYVLILEMLLKLQPWPLGSDKGGIDSMIGATPDRTALQAAAGCGHLEMVALLLANGADVNAKPSEDSGRTALQAAAEVGHLQIVKLLLGGGAHVNARPSFSYGRTALRAAAECGHLEVVGLLLEKGADVNPGPGCYYGQTALQAAAEGGHLEVVKLLLDKGADINAKLSYYDRTALQAAAEVGNFEVVRLLLERGANLDIGPDSLRDRQALREAAVGGHLEVVRLLLDASANAEQGKDSGRTAFQEAAAGGHLEAVRLLLERGVNCNIELGSPHDRRALREAALGGHLKVVRLILLRSISTRANTKLCGDNCRTILQEAAAGGHLEAVRLLLETGADANAEPNSSCGRMALQAAAEEWRSEMEFSQILDRLADLKTKPNSLHGRTALQVAAEGGHLEVVRLLLENGADVNAGPSKDSGRTPLQAAADEGNLEVVRFYQLLERLADLRPEQGSSCVEMALQAAAAAPENGADPKANSSPSHGRTALQAAAEKGHLEVVMFLLENGADVNAGPSDYYGRTALQAAAEEGHLKVVKFLLENGADVNTGPSDYYGRTALQGAAEAGHLEVVRLLLERRADPNIGPGLSHGRSAFLAAARGGHLEVVRLLLESGADIDTEPACFHVQTALEAAADGGNLETLRLILETEVDLNAGRLSSHDQAALQAAVELGNLELARRLVNQHSKLHQYQRGDEDISRTIYQRMPGYFPQAASGSTSQRGSLRCGDTSYYQPIGYIIIFIIIIIIIIPKSYELAWGSRG